MSLTFDVCRLKNAVSEAEKNADPAIREIKMIASTSSF
jgi:hypothetical protein